MKKMMSFIVAIAMISNTAFATSVNNAPSHEQMIAKTFNEFRYKMTVSEDANNPDFREKAVTEFQARMNDLQAEGVSAEEIMSHMRSNLLDASARKDFDALFASINASKISGEEAGNLAMQFMASKYQQGASYSGAGKANLKIAAIIIGVVIVGVVVCICIKKNQRNRTATVTVTETKTVTDTNTDVCYDANGEPYPC